MGAPKRTEVTRILPDTADLRQAVQETINAVKITAVHAGAAKLALDYADAIDADACTECGGHREALEKLGPKLLAALEALGATPAGKPGKPTAAAKPASELEKLRAARSRRKD